MTRYITTADTAKLIRTQLKTKFPGIKFGVRSHVYSGGSSIRIDWIDGPTTDMVNKIVKPFEGSGFDGMIDMRYNKESFLLPDGSAALAQTPGTEGSAGIIPKVKAFKPCAEAERVSFSPDHIFTERRTSRRLVDSALLSFRRHWGEDEATKIKIYDERLDGSCYASADDWDIQHRFHNILARRIIAA